RVIAFHVGIVPDMARPRRRQRQEIGANRAFIRSPIGPKGPPRLPIRPQAFVVRNRVLNDESLDPVRMGPGHAKTHGAAVALRETGKHRAQRGELKKRIVYLHVKTPAPSAGLRPRQSTSAAAPMA